jgi:aryl-alcohol dehydrogenase-like predicted oxidoreductase
MGCIRKLALGTVQWGMAYGVANRTGQPAFADVGHMLQVAKDRGITLLDTAYSYGEAEMCLGNQGRVSQGFRIVTKTQPLRTQEVTEQEVTQVVAAFFESLQRLRCTRIYGLLVHYAENLLMAGGERLWVALQKLKVQNYTEKIGVSLYHPHQLEKILESIQIDLVQLPLNLYDQRFIQTSWLERLKKDGIEVHTRSAFLQGLLLLPTDQIPKHCSSIRQHQAHLHKQLYESGMSPMEGALAFCLGQPNVDQVVVGCENVKQLQEILAVAEHPKVVSREMEAYAVHEHEIINPSRWPT